MGSDVKLYGGPLFWDFRLGTKTAHSTPSPSIFFPFLLPPYSLLPPTFILISLSLFLILSLSLVFLIFPRIILLYIKYNRTAQHTHKIKIYIPISFVDSWYAANLTIYLSTFLSFVWYLIMYLFTVYETKSIYFLFSVSIFLRFSLSDLRSEATVNRLQSRIE